MMPARRRTKGCFCPSMGTGLLSMWELKRDFSLSLGRRHLFFTMYHPLQMAFYQTVDFRLTPVCWWRGSCSQSGWWRHLPNKNDSTTRLLTELWCCFHRLLHCSTGHSLSNLLLSSQHQILKDSRQFRQLPVLNCLSSHIDQLILLSVYSIWAWIGHSFADTSFFRSCTCLSLSSLGFGSWFRGRRSILRQLPLGSP